METQRGGGVNEQERLSAEEPLTEDQLESRRVHARDKYNEWIRGEHENDTLGVFSDDSLRLLATIDALRASLSSAEAERDEAQRMLLERLTVNDAQLEELRASVARLSERLRSTEGFSKELTAAEALLAEAEEALSRISATAPRTILRSAAVKYSRTVLARIRAHKAEKQETKS